MAFTIRSEHASPDYVLTTLSDPTILDPNNGFAHTVTIGTKVALSDLAADAAIDVAGPDLVVSASVDGLWLDGDALNVAITVTGGTDISTSILNGTGDVLGPDEFAQLVASSLNTIGAGDILCSSDGGLVSISALAAVTALTITTWAVAP